MDAFSVIPVVLAVAVPVGLVLIVGVIVLAGRSRPQAGLGPRPSSTAQGPAGPPEGVWNALILGSGAIGALGGTLGSQRGRFHVHGGWLAFLPDGADQPQWQVPCTQLAARAHSAFSTAGVELWLPSAYLRCQVSREHINTVSRNTLKSMREPKYYAEFVAALGANGARVG